MVAALAAALLATGLALVIVRRALAPLTRTQQAAESVATSQDPSVRVPEGRPDEVGLLSRAINRMLGRLEDAQGRLRATLSEQRRFAADASHEMRTPLTALRGDIETMRAHDLPPGRAGGWRSRTWRPRWTAWTASSRGCWAWPASTATTARWSGWTSAR